MVAAPSLTHLPFKPISIAGTRHEQRLGKIRRPEYAFLSFFTLTLCGLTSVPYVLGRLLHFPGDEFTGVLNHSLDANNYLAYVQQSALGAWLFRNPMTPEPHSAVFLNLEWLIAGKLAAVPGISLALATDIERLVCLCVMCFAVYWLATHLFRSVAGRRIATVAIMTGGGFGWLAAAHVFHIPLDSSYFLDLTNANLFPFYWALKLPHFLVSESFVILGFALFLHGEETLKTRYFVASGFSYMAAGMCRPYDMLYAMAATALFITVEGIGNRRVLRNICRRSLPLSLCVPLLVYYFWIFKLHPIFHWWRYFGNPAPTLWLLAVGYGPSFLILVYGLTKIRQSEMGPADRFMICCLVAAVALTYAHHWFHFAFQFATNILVPMLLVAFVLLKKTASSWTRRVHWANALLMVALIANSLTSLALTAQAVWLVKTGDFQIESARLQAYGWILSNSQSGEIILADFEHSNEMPQYTHNTVFCGYINAVEFKKKLESVELFFDPRVSDNFRQKLLQQYNVHYILLTPTEYRDLRAAGRILFLTECYRNTVAVILGNNKAALATGS